MKPLNPGDPDRQLHTANYTDSQKAGQARAERSMFPSLLGTEGFPPSEYLSGPERGPGSM